MEPPDDRRRSNGPHRLRQLDRPSKLVTKLVLTRVNARLDGYTVEDQAFGYGLAGSRERTVARRALQRVAPYRGERCRRARTRLANRTDVRGAPTGIKRAGTQSQSKCIPIALFTMGVPRGGLVAGVNTATMPPRGSPGWSDHSRSGDFLVAITGDFLMPLAHRDLRPLPALDPTSAVTRTIEFGRTRIGGVWTIDGRTFSPDRIDAQPSLGTTETWTFVNKSDAALPHPRARGRGDDGPVRGGPVTRRHGRLTPTAPVARLRSQPAGGR